MSSLTILVPIFLLATMHLVETLSWSVRAASFTEGVGHVIARTNILLYGARFFALGFTTFIFFLIESGLDATALFLVLAMCFLGSAIMQALALNKIFVSFFAKLINKNAKLNRLPRKFYPILFIKTAFANIFFSAAIIIPILLAVSFPAYRMTLANLGPILNAFGTILLIFFVDTKLYAKMDEGTLHEFIFTYICGRSAGLSFGFLFSLTFIL